MCLSRLIASIAVCTLAACTSEEACQVAYEKCIERGDDPELCRLDRAFCTNECLEEDETDEPDEE